MLDVDISLPNLSHDGARRPIYIFVLPLKVRSLGLKIYRKSFCAAWNGVHKVRMRHLPNRFVAISAFFLAIREQKMFVANPFNGRWIISWNFSLTVRHATSFCWSRPVNRSPLGFSGETSHRHSPRRKRINMITLYRAGVVLVEVGLLDT